MTYRDVLQEAEECLKAGGVLEYKQDAWQLFSHIFSMERHSYFLKMNDSVNDFERVDKFRKAVTRRGNREPLQYITGKQWFMGLEFEVDKSVLIPRHDTEILVEKALQLMDSVKGDNLKVMDMCTGSGCIAISIASLFLKKKVEVTAVDLSKEALNVALRNKNLNNTDNVRLVNSNLFEEFDKNTDCEHNTKYDIIVSNPPYIPSREIEELAPEVKAHEPAIALDGAEDGLKFYKDITLNSINYLRDGGWLLYEIGCHQAGDVKKIMENGGFSHIEVVKDLAGLDRVVYGRKERKE